MLTNAEIGTQEQKLEEGCNTPSSATPLVGGHDTQHISGSRFLRWRKGVRPDAMNMGAIDGLQDQTPAELFPPFELHENLSIWMYCTCAPCGDASMELCMAAQEDSTPWDVSSPNTPNLGDEPNPTMQLLDGRAYFSILGVVRRKPSRADAEPTLSKSCSDKIAVKQVTSILSFPASLLVAPTKSAYIKSFLLPAEEISRVACDRCFGSGETGRFKPLKNKIWTNASAPGLEYAYHPFEVRSLPTDRFKSLWDYDKSADPAKAKNYKPGNISAVWTAAPTHAVQSLQSKGSPPSTNLLETLVNSVRQGYHISSPSGRKASALSRARMWDLLREVMELLSTHSLERNGAATVREERIGEGLASAADSAIRDQGSHYESLLSSETYASLKQRVSENEACQSRKQALADVREILGNWIPNHGDEDWTLDVLKENKPLKARAQVQCLKEDRGDNAKADKGI